MLCDCGDMVVESCKKDSIVLFWSGNKESPAVEEGWSQVAGTLGWV